MALIPFPLALLRWFQHAATTVAVDLDVHFVVLPQVTRWLSLRGPLFGNSLPNNKWHFGPLGGLRLTDGFDVF